MEQGWDGLFQRTQSLDGLADIRTKHEDECINIYHLLQSERGQVFMKWLENMSLMPINKDGDGVTIGLELARREGERSLIRLVKHMYKEGETLNVKRAKSN